MPVDNAPPRKRRHNVYIADDPPRNPTPRRRQQPCIPDAPPLTPTPECGVCFNAFSAGDRLRQPVVFQECGHSVCRECSDRCTTPTGECICPFDRIVNRAPLCNNFGMIEMMGNNPRAHHATIVNDRQPQSLAIIMTFINILIAVSCMVILVAVLVRVIGYSVPVEGTNDNSKFFLPNATKPVIQDKKPPPSLNIIWRGGWRDDVSYEPYDGVSMDGSFYVAVTVSKNSPPPSGDWVVHLNSLDDKKMHDEIQRITKIMDTHRQLAPRLITGKSVVKLYYQENVHKCGVSQTWHGWNKHVFEFKNELISDVRVKVTLVCAPEKLFTMEFTALALTTENNSIGHTHLELRGKQCQLMTEVEALDTVDPDDFFALPPITVTC